MASSLEPGRVHQTHSPAEACRRIRVLFIDAGHLSYAGAAVDEQLPA